MYHSETLKWPLSLNKTYGNNKIDDIYVIGDIFTLQKHLLVFVFLEKGKGCSSLENNWIANVVRILYHESRKITTRKCTFGDEHCSEINPNNVLSWKIFCNTKHIVTTCHCRCLWLKISRQLEMQWHDVIRNCTRKFRNFAAVGFFYLHTLSCNN